MKTIAKIICCLLLCLIPQFCFASDLLEQINGTWAGPAGVVTFDTKNGTINASFYEHHGQKTLKMKEQLNSMAAKLDIGGVECSVALLHPNKIIMMQEAEEDKPASMLIFYRNGVLPQKIGDRHKQLSGVWTNYIARISFDFGAMKHGVFVLGKESTYDFKVIGEQDGDVFIEFDNGRKALCIAEGDELYYHQFGKLPMGLHRNKN